MGVFTVGVDAEFQEVVQSLDSKLRKLERKDMMREIAKEESGNFVVFRCVDNRQDTALTDVEFSREIAEALADTIAEDVQEILIRQIVTSSSLDLTEQEQDDVISGALERLWVEDFSESRCRGISSTVNTGSRRTTRLVLEILDYMHNSDHMILSGFVRFRLKDYFQQIRDAVDEALDTYFEEQEHEEFIQLLKYFVDAQEPKIGEVHIILDGGGVFKLVDSHRNVIDNVYLGGFLTDIPEDEIDYDDLLLSALITIAPAVIVLHYKHDYSVVHTLKKVFRNKVIVCHDCELCGVESDALHET